MMALAAGAWRDGHTGSAPPPPAEVWDMRQHVPTDLDGAAPPKSEEKWDEKHLVPAWLWVPRTAREISCGPRRSRLTTARSHSPAPLPMKTLQELLTLRPSVHDTSRRDQVLDLTNLTAGTVNAAEFFAENFVTDGMRQLLREGFRRLSGQSEQGVFVLSQAMGGGKTHNMIALGLLAQHPGLRAGVMGADYTAGANLGAVRVVSFTGRENDAPLGIWEPSRSSWERRSSSRTTTARSRLRGRARG